MRFGKILAAAAALSLTASPVLAQSASALSLGSSVRAAASLEEESDAAGGFIIPALAVIAVILAVVVIADSGSDSPTSP